MVVKNDVFKDYHFTLDLDNGYTEESVIKIIQSSNGVRYFDIDLTKETLPFNLSNCLVKAVYIKPSDLPVVRDVQIVDVNGQIKAELTEQCMTEDGNVRCEIVVIDLIGSRFITFPMFKFKVKGSLFVSSGIESVSEFQTLLDAIVKVDKINEVADEKFATIDSQLERAMVIISNLDVTLEEGLRLLTEIEKKYSQSVESVQEIFENLSMSDQLLETVQVNKIAVDNLLGTVVANDKTINDKKNQAVSNVNMITENKLDSDTLLTNIRNNKTTTDTLLGRIQSNDAESSKTLTLTKNKDTEASKVLNSINATHINSTNTYNAIVETKVASDLKYNEIVSTKNNGDILYDDMVDLKINSHNSLNNINSLLDKANKDITNMNNTFSENESQRQSVYEQNELERTLGENARKVDEATRKTSETARVTSENTRKSSETSRVTAETTRQTTFDTLKTNMQNTMTAIEDRAKACMPVIEQSANEIENARIDYLANRHANIKDAMDANVRHAQNAVMGELNTTTVTGTNMTVSNAIAERIPSAIVEGKTEIVVGKNKFSGGFVTGAINNDNGLDIVDDLSARSEFIEVESNKEYVFNKTAHWIEYGESKGFIQYIGVVNSGTPKTTSQNCKYLRFYRSKTAIENPQLEKGSVVTEYEKYIKELVSVKFPVLSTTGKNLFDGELISGRYTIGQGSWFADSSACCTKHKIQVRPSTSYFLSIQNNVMLYNISEYNNGVFIKTTQIATSDLKFMTTSTTNEINISFNTPLSTTPLAQFEMSESKTTYEPHKSSILSTLEEVKLGSVDTVKDKFNHVTGEVVENTKEFVINKDDSTWLYESNLQVFSVVVSDLINTSVAGQKPLVISEMYSGKTQAQVVNNKEEGICSSWSNNRVQIRDTRFTSLADFKNSIPNGIKVRYIKTTPTTKTVATKGDLVAFDGITHITSSSNTFAPNASVVVPSHFKKTISNSIANLETQTEKANIDYMGNTHENIRKAMDSNVEYCMGEINTLDYEGQHITATNTLESRAKSAVLVGNTLVNIARKLNSSSGSDRLRFVTNEYTKNICKAGVYTIVNKSNKKIQVDVSEKTTNSWKQVFVIGSNASVLVTLDDNRFFSLNTGLFSEGWTSSDLLDFEKSLVIVEGDNIDKDVPYFTGMQSVRMPVLTTTGKQLFNKETVKPPLAGASSELYVSSDYIKIDNSSKYYKNNKTSHFFYDDNFNKLNADGSQELINPPTGSFYFRCNLLKTELDSFQVEQGTVATTYESYKTNILSTLEPVTLGKIGTVADTLDLLTGEVVNNFNDLILDGSEDWQYDYNYTANPDLLRFNLSTQTPYKMSGVCLSDKLICNNNPSAVTNFECVGLHSINRMICMYISKTKCSDLTTFKTWLSQNKVTVKYELLEKVVKTVELSDHYVYSYKDVTHYDCSAEEGSLVPTLNVSVPTNLQAVIQQQSSTISTLSLENEQLQEELTAVKEESQNGDLDLLVGQWDIDYRLYEIEAMIDTPATMSLNKKTRGVDDMSKYLQAKTLILGGRYVRSTMEAQLTRYCKDGVITQEEYDELVSLMDARELVQC